MSHITLILIYSTINYELYIYKANQTMRVSVGAIFFITFHYFLILYSINL